MPKENPKQREAFLAYFNLGTERSLENLCRQMAKLGPETKVSITTLKAWSAKFGWQQKIQEMDAKAGEAAEAIAIKEASIPKSKILQICRNIFTRTNQALISGTMPTTVADFKRAWEIHNTELGLSTGQDRGFERPQVNIFITKNERILAIYNRDTEDIKKALAEEIEKQP